jgi:hypothetical protein
VLRAIVAAVLEVPAAVVVLPRAGLKWLPVAALALRPRAGGTRTINARAGGTWAVLVSAIKARAVRAGSVMARPVVALAARRTVLRPLLRTAELAPGAAGVALWGLAARGTALRPLLPGTEIARGVARAARGLLAAWRAARRSLLGATEAASGGAVRRPVARSARPVGTGRFHVRSVYAGPWVLPSQARPLIMDRSVGLGVGADEMLGLVARGQARPASTATYRVSHLQPLPIRAIQCKCIVPGRPPDHAPD